MRRPMPATGLKMLPAVKSIVSIILIRAFLKWLNKSNINIFFSALCKDDANGNVPLGKSCNRYWACQGGYPRLQRCPAMLVFDKNRKRCVTPPTEDCEVPTTNTPNQEDDDQGSEQQQEPTGSAPRSPNPKRGGDGGASRRSGQRPQQLQAQPLSLDGSSIDNLPFNLPAGAVPLNQN